MATDEVWVGNWFYCTICGLGGGGGMSNISSNLYLTN
jgi:hypothetical protein